MPRRGVTKLDLALAPKLGLLVKLGSIAVHAEEMTSPGWHQVDLAALQSLLRDAEVQEWVAVMTDAGFLPVKRS